MQDKFNKASPPKPRNSKAAHDTCSQYDQMAFLYDVKNSRARPVDLAEKNREETQKKELLLLNFLVNNQGLILSVLQFFIKSTALIILFPFFFIFYLVPKWMIVKPLCIIHHLIKKQILKLNVLKIKFSLLMERWQERVAKTQEKIKLAFQKRCSIVKSYLKQKIGAFKKRLRPLGMPFMKVLEFSLMLGRKTKQLMKGFRENLDQSKIFLKEFMKKTDALLKEKIIRGFSHVNRGVNTLLLPLKNLNQKLEQSIESIKTPKYLKIISAWIINQKERLINNYQALNEKILASYKKCEQYVIAKKSRFWAMFSFSELKNVRFKIPTFHVRFLKTTLKKGREFFFRIQESLKKFPSGCQTIVHRLLTRMRSAYLSLTKIKILFIKMKEKSISTSQRILGSIQSPERVLLTLWGSICHCLLWKKAFFKYVFKLLNDTLRDVKKSFNIPIQK